MTVSLQLYTCFPLMIVIPDMQGENNVHFTTLWGSLVPLKKNVLKFLSWSGAVELPLLWAGSLPAEHHHKNSHGFEQVWS